MSKIHTQTYNIQLQKTKDRKNLERSQKKITTKNKTQTNFTCRGTKKTRADLYSETVHAGRVE